MSNDHCRSQEKESNSRAHTQAYGVHVPKEGGRASSPGGRAGRTPGQEPRWPSLPALAGSTEVTWPDLSSAQQERKGTLGVSRPHWPLGPGVLDKKQKRLRLWYPLCCLTAYLEVRCSEAQETNGSEGRACAFRSGAWAPWLYRSLAAGLWARFPIKGPRPYL